jgi:ppGpp synthetase/RelA/SpoT-type nucleotidyltranferase
MVDLNLTKDKFKDLPALAFGTWYDQAYENLQFVADRLRADLTGYANQTGSNILAFFSVRVKGKESFVDKIDALRRDEYKLNNLFIDSNSILQVQDIIKDLIGARLVLYFLNEIHLAINYFSIYPTFRIEEAEAYQAMSDDSPLAGKYRSNLFSRIREVVNDFNPKPKSSGDEAIHLIVRYREPYATTRSLVTAPPDVREEYMNKWKQGIPIESRLTVFPIEVQIRTILEHTWAQIEHRMNYNLRKLGWAESTDDPLLMEDFRCHKMLLYSAEHHQRIMYERFWNLRNRPPYISKKGSIEINEFELQYFDEVEAEKISKININIDGKNTAKTIRDLKNMIDDLEIKYNQRFLSLTFEEGDLEKWARKRLILLSIAYVLLTGDEETRERVHNILEDRIKSSTQDTYLDEISLYEYIRNVDAFFRMHPSIKDDERKLLTDPIVVYRCAGAYLKIGDLRRSIHLLKEVLDHHYLDNYPVGGSADKILSEMHFLRRIGEYYHFVYLRDGQLNHEDLVNACNFMTKAYASKKGPKNPDTYKLEFSKILSNLIVFYFNRYLLQEYENKAGFINKINELEDDIAEYFDEESIIEQKRIYASEALAIYKFFKNDIGKAKRLITKSLSMAENKTQNPFLYLITKQIYQYIQKGSDKH